MARIRDIVEFLEARGLSARVAWGSGVEADATVSGVRTDQDARGGDLAWLSPKAAAAAPDRVAEFRGSVLIAPAEPVAANGAAVVIACENPKLAFTLVVDEFFRELTESAWPTGTAVVHPSARVSATAVLSAGVVIGGDTTIGDDVWIGPNSCIANTSIDRAVRIGSGCAIGLPGFGLERSPDGTWVRFPHVGRVVIEEGVEIGSNTCIDRGSLGDTRIGRGARIDNLVHVAHNVVIGENALVIAHAMLGGSARVGAGAWVAPSVAILNQVSIGASATIGLGAVVIRDVAPGDTVVGNPAKPLNRK
jgi:UDP-3-O-[3-hydroxymyristoyl] glucosamine N-acyltransferase